MGRTINRTFPLPKTHSTSQPELRLELRITEYNVQLLSHSRLYCADTSSCLLCGCALDVVSLSRARASLCLHVLQGQCKRKIPSLWFFCHLWIQLAIRVFLVPTSIQCMRRSCLRAVAFFGNCKDFLLQEALPRRRGGCCCC